MPLDCYLAPGYWDLAFSDETALEADFVDAVAGKYLTRPDRAVLEIGCGGGRLVIELARRGWDVTAIDNEPACVAHVHRRLQRAASSANVLLADMTDLPFRDTFDVAHCFVNTFRHLTTEAAARSHLSSVARVLKPGGVYLLGFHLLPPDAVELDSERWTVTRGTTRVTTTIRVLTFDRRRRLERVRFSLKVTTPRGVRRFRSDHLLRIYRADQFRSLLRSVPELELIDTFDFCYDLAMPRTLDDELGDAVFVLRRRGEPTHSAAARSRSRRA